MRTALVRRVIEPALLLTEVQRAANGAAVLFFGTVREVNDRRTADGWTVWGSRRVG